MKQIENPLPRISSEKQFPLKSVLLRVSIVTLFCYVAAIVGCSYYKVKPIEPLSHEGAMNKSEKQKNISYFIKENKPGIFLMSPQMRLRRN
jgi:hypothetical protein